MLTFHVSEVLAQWLPEKGFFFIGLLNDRYGKNKLEFEVTLSILERMGVQ